MSVSAANARDEAEVPATGHQAIGGVFSEKEERSARVSPVSVGQAAQDAGHAKLLTRRAASKRRCFLRGEPVKEALCHLYVCDERIPTPCCLLDDARTEKMMENACYICPTSTVATKLARCRDPATAQRGQPQRHHPRRRDAAVRHRHTCRV